MDDLTGMNVNNNPLGPNCHFPTPWKIVPLGSVHKIVDANNTVVCESICHTSDVVNYVNQHNNLVLALEALLTGAIAAQAMLAEHGQADTRLNGGIVVAKGTLVECVLPSSGRKTPPKEKP